MKKQQTLAERLILLREEYSITPEKMGAILNKSRVAVDNIEKGITTKPQETTINLIAEKFGTTKEWLMNGEGVMLPNGKLKLSSTAQADGGIWKDEAYFEVKSKNALLEKELERLWQMVQHLTGGAKPNFRKAFNLTDFSKGKALKAPAYS